jgi:death on curing protein
VSKREPFWIDERDVFTVHERLLALHGGLSGVRDRGLLESALARPRQHFSYGENVDIIEMAALYTVGIVQNHPFVDGNKRAGFMAGALFPEVNGFDFLAREEDVITTVLALAAGDLDEAGYAKWLRSNVKQRRKNRKARYQKG